MIDKKKKNEFKKLNSTNDTKIKGYEKSQIFSHITI